MDANLQPVYDRVMQARRAEDAFKDLGAILPPRLLAEHLAPEMEEMRKVLEENAYSDPDNRAAAKEARETLELHYADALKKAGKGLYVLDDFHMLTPSSGKRIDVGKNTYFVGEKFHVGEHSALYRGRINIDGGSAGVVIRVANTPDDNPFLFREIRVLDVLHREDVGYWRNFPFLLDRFMTSDRVGIIYRYFDGVTLTHIRSDQLHRDGLDQRHAIWILDRMLGLLGYVHNVGVVHGRIEPERIRVRPSNHNVMLSGWGCGVFNPEVTGETVLSTGGVFEAPELKSRQPIGPWTDIYCLGKSIIWLLGGDPKTNEIPETVHPKFQKFLRTMVYQNIKARPKDAWQLYQAQNRLKDSLWKRQFIHLNLTKR